MSQAIPQAILAASLLCAALGAPAAEPQASEPPAEQFKIAVYSGPSAERSSMSLASSSELALASKPAYGSPSLASSDQLASNSFSVGTTISYVASVESDCSGPEAACRHAITPGEVTSGLQFSIERKDDGVYRMAFSMSELTALATFTSKDAKGGEVSVQLPSTSISAADTTARLLPRQTLLLTQMHVEKTATHAETYYVVEATRLR